MGDPSQVTENSMVAYSRVKEKHCRNCDLVVNQRLGHLVCQLCRWKFHLRCTTVSDDDYHRIIGSDGSIIFKCSWCSETGALIDPLWYTFDTQSCFKWFQKQFDDYKKTVENSRKSITKTNKLYSTNITDLNRKFQVASSSYISIQKKLKNTEIELSKTITKYELQTRQIVTLTDEINALKNSPRFENDDYNTVVKNLTTELGVLKEKLNTVPELETEIQRLRVQLATKPPDTSFRPPLNKRGREKSPLSNDRQNKVRRIEVDTSDTKPTFAEIIRGSPTPIENYVNVNIIGPDADELVQKLADKKLCNENGILSSQKRSNGTFTLKFSNSTDNDQFRKIITEKYKDNVVFNQLKPYSPTMKIVCLDDLQNSIEEIISEIKLSNKFKCEFELVREYFIDTPRRTYRNVVIKCDTDDLATFVSNGIQIGAKKYRVYEIIRTVQCFRCYNFGHISRNCTNKVICRHCAGNHDFKECTSLDAQPTCFNCKMKGMSFNHRVTADNCQVKIDRIDGLKTFLLKRNQNSKC